MRGRGPEAHKPTGCSECTIAPNERPHRRCVHLVARYGDVVGHREHLLPGNPNRPPGPPINAPVEPHRNNDVTAGKLPRVAQAQPIVWKLVLVMRTGV
jgi:hypothetical protein